MYRWEIIELVTVSNFLIVYHEYNSIILKTFIVVLRIIVKIVSVCFIFNYLTTSLCASKTRNIEVELLLFLTRG